MIDFNNIVRPLPIFDKIYTTKQDMENGCATDEIHIGRFVLVTDQENGYNNTVWQKVVNGINTSYQLVADWDPVTNSIIKTVKDFPFEYSDAAVTYSKDINSGEYKYTFKPAGQLRYQIKTENDSTITTLTEFSESLLKQWAKIKSKFSEYENTNSSVMIARWNENDTWSSISESMP